jgi:hypothetical protein
MDRYKPIIQPSTLLQNVPAVADCGDFFCPALADQVLPEQQRNNS